MLKPPVVTFRFRPFVETLMLSGETQRRDLSSYQSKEMINNIHSPERDRTHNRHVYSKKL